MSKNTLLIVAGLSVGAVTAVGCIQTMGMQLPRDSGQLPTDIFKVHVHIATPPLDMPVALPMGTVTIPLKQGTTDPQTEFLAVIAGYEADPVSHRRFEERNDYAAALLFANRYSDAIPVLIQMEKDYPGKYSTASNLGTAYELVGDDLNAEVWIKKGIERNAESHDGTEWLHLAILEAKQNLKKDPNWLFRHSVLDGQEKRERAEVEHALEYQLNERLYFIHKDDPVMCDLFYQAAVITSDLRKRAYFLRQVPRFGTVRDNQVRRLLRG